MLTSTIWRILAPAYYAIRHAGSYEDIDPMQGWEMAREWALGEKAASRDYSCSVLSHTATAILPVNAGSQ